MPLRPRGGKQQLTRRSNTGTRASWPGGPFSQPASRVLYESQSFHFSPLRFQFNAPRSNSQLQVLFGTGDVLAQQAVDRRGLEKHDFGRTGRMTLYGGGTTPIYPNNFRF
jgi:hypothetical protein